MTLQNTKQVKHKEKDPWTRQDEQRFTLRLKLDIYNPIKEIAKREKRSTAKQIEFILEEYLKNQK